MFKTSPVLLVLLATTIFGITLACGQDQPPAKSATDAQAQPVQSTGGALATVNGTPIDQTDVDIAMSSGRHAKQLPPEQTRNILETIVRQELIRQKAVELGLNANASYQQKLRGMQAQIEAFKRRELSNLFWRDIAGRVAISDAEAKNYFTENADRIRTELHVWQLLWRKEDPAEDAWSDMERGASFEEMVKRRFPDLPESAGSPWDLGYLKWTQIPKAWRKVVYDLKKGETSGLIRGPNHRFWIIKLIDKRQNQALTFESSKDTIVEVVKNAKIQELRRKIDQDLRAKAKILYFEAPPRQYDD